MDIKITLVRHSQLCGTLVMNNLWMPLPKTPRFFGVVELLGRQLSWISGTCFVCPCKGMVKHWGRNRNVFCEVVFVYKNSWHVSYMFRYAANSVNKPYKRYFTSVVENPWYVCFRKMSLFWFCDFSYHKKVCFSTGAS